MQLPYDFAESYDGCIFCVTLKKNERGIVMDIEGYVRFLEGMSGFIFFNRFFEVHVPEGINRQITRIIERYNLEEEVVAKKQKETRYCFRHMD